jgi:hypothetical protein
MRHLAQIANAFVSQVYNFRLTGESMGPKNTSGSPSSQAIRTAVSKALIVIGNRGGCDRRLMPYGWTFVGAQRLLLERLDGRRVFAIGSSSTAIQGWCAVASQVVIGWLLRGTPVLKAAGSPVRAPITSTIAESARFVFTASAQFGYPLAGS